MTVPREITTIKAGTEFRTCPSCGYELGFHTSFIGTNTDKSNPVKSTREVYRVILICPECGARFDVGWRASFPEAESQIVVAPAGSPTTLHNPAVTLVPALPPHERSSPE